MDAALCIWKIAGAEMVMSLNEYEKFHYIGPEIYIGKSHEDYPAFQEMVFDVTNLFNCFKDTCNPFEENELIVSDTSEVP